MMASMRSDAVLSWLSDTGTPEDAAGLSRFGIPNETAFGVPMGVMKKKAKSLGIDHPTAQMLWRDGRYEARIMAVHLADPDVMTEDEADRWCAEFDNWAICDTACYVLFDRLPFRWKKVPQYTADNLEFVRRAGFALVWAMTVHDKTAPDDLFRSGLAEIETYAWDKRPLVKKAVDMALRSIGKKNLALHKAAVATAERLCDRPEKPAAWIGRHALKELTSEKTLKRLASK